VSLLDAKEVLDVRDTSRRAIFFLDASQTGVLSARQMCAVESASKNNPGADVYVLVLSPPSDLSLVTNEALKIVSRHYKNVQILSLRPSDFSSISSTENFQSQQHILAISVIKKFGGVYLDMDLVVLKPLGHLDTNFVCFYHNEEISNVVFGFEKNNSFLAEWIQNRNLNNRISDFSSAFNILPTKVFFPLDSSHWKFLFKNTNFKKVSTVVEESSAIHVWNALSDVEQISVGSNQAYSLLAKEHCPRSYWSCYNQF